MKTLNEAMKKLQENKKIVKEELLWSSECESDDEWDVLLDDFKSMLLPNIEKQCRNNVLILAGSVGRWDGKSTGGTVINPDDLLSFADVDEIKIEEDDGQLVWKGIHHDGTHIMDLYTIPEEEEKRKKIVMDLGIYDWLKEMYNYDTDEDCMEDALSRLDTVNNLKDVLSPDDYGKAYEYFKPIRKE